MSRTFDEDGNPSHIITAGVTNNYTIDNASRITGISDSGLASNSWTFGYDLFDRINSGTSTALTRGYTYDANSNRLTTTGTNPSAETIAAASNQLNSTTGSITRTYGYDTAGNVTSFNGEAFSFGQRGRMTSATSSAGKTNYFYNALGQLIEKSGNGGTTLFMYDEAGHILGEYTATGALIEETIWTGDLPVATLRPNGSTGCTSTVCVFYVHTDHLNTPRKITRPSDNGLMWRWDPDTFGSVAPNQNPSGLGTFVYNLRFPGQYSLNESGLYYTYYRDYDPQMGRYIESDPIGLLGGSLATYAYANSRSISRIDPFGLAPPSVVPPVIGVPAAQQNAMVAQQLANPDDFYNLVRSRGAWDYKQYGNDLQDFGNYNFGVVAAASGFFRLRTALKQAGRAQCIAQTSDPKWGRPDLGPPYGDDPNDQHWITEGWNDYMSGMYGPPRSPRLLGLWPAATDYYSDHIQPPLPYCSNGYEYW